MKFVAKLIGGLFLLLLLFALGNLLVAHVTIRQERPAMPDIADVLALAGEADRPVRLTYVNTSTQRDPDGSVLIHPVFVVEWSDGRTLLVDTGMDGEAALAFGVPAEWLLGSDPVVVHRTIDRALGDTRDRVAGLVFTHLHSDHTQGIGLLCDQSSKAIDVFMPPAQFDRPNYTTGMGLEPVEDAVCAKRLVIGDDGLARLPGFNGVGVVRAAGHTPGSQLIVLWVGEVNPRGYVLAGDVVFEFEQIERDTPKPLVYRLLITPEADGQLQIVRRYLRTLLREHGMTVIPSHDYAHLKATGLSEF